MNRPTPAIGLLLVLGIASSCGPTIPEDVFACDSEADCPSGWQCVGARCLSEAAAGACSTLCGDVDQDGIFDADDASALTEVLASPEDRSGCVRKAADLYRDEQLDGRDGVVMQWLLSTDLPPGRCEACPRCNGICGDANMTGAVDSEDVEQIEELVEAGGTAAALCGCQFWAADVTGDGRIDSTDEERLSAVVSEGGPLQCGEQ